VTPSLSSSILPSLDQDQRNSNLLVEGRILSIIERIVNKVDISLVQPHPVERNTMSRLHQEQKQEQVGMVILPEVLPTLQQEQVVQHLEQLGRKQEQVQMPELEQLYGNHDSNHDAERMIVVDNPLRSAFSNYHLTDQQQLSPSYISYVAEGVWSEGDEEDGCSFHISSSSSEDGMDDCTVNYTLLYAKKYICLTLWHLYTLHAFLSHCKAIFYRYKRYKRRSINAWMKWYMCRCIEKEMTVEAEECDCEIKTRRLLDRWHRVAANVSRRRRRLLYGQYSST
jgi:hypothetical protein